MSDWTVRERVESQEAELVALREVAEAATALMPLLPIPSIYDEAQPKFGYLLAALNRWASFHAPADGRVAASKATNGGSIPPGGAA